MLVLERQRNQRIVIGDGEIIVTVTAIKGGRVFIGIDAPPTVRVMREELLDRATDHHDHGGRAEP
jgi:carbon storage regulator